MKVFEICLSDDYLGGTTHLLVDEEINRKDKLLDVIQKALEEGHLLSHWQKVYDYASDPKNVVGGGARSIDYRVEENIKGHTLRWSCNRREVLSL